MPPPTASRSARTHGIGLCALQHYLRQRSALSRVLVAGSRRPLRAGVAGLPRLSGMHVAATADLDTRGA